MACFLIPAAEAVVATIAAKVLKSKEKEPKAVKLDLTGEGLETVAKTPFSRKMKWLTNLLWGGSALLAFEHVWHGEVVPWFPFLTAAGNAEDAAEMLHEMATAGVAMAALVTVVWLGIVAVISVIERKALKSVPAKKGKGTV